MSFARIALLFVILATGMCLVPSADGGFMLGPPPPAFIAMTADIVVVGKIVEIEADAVEAPPHEYRPPARKGAADKPAIPKVRHRIAVLKIDEALIGAKG